MKNAAGSARRNLWVLEDEPGGQFIFEDVLGESHSLRFFSRLDEYQHAHLNESSKPDLLLADLRLKDGNFLSFLNSLPSGQTLGYPFVVVSSMDDLEILRQCFRRGAADYLTKPFKAVELVAKVERILGVAEDKSLAGDDWLGLKIEAEGLRATRQGRSIDLTPKELQILHCLFQLRGAPLVRAKILEKVWRETQVGSKTLDVHIFHLRRKVRALGLSITMVPGEGFCLTDQVTSDCDDENDDQEF